MVVIIPPVAAGVVAVAGAALAWRRRGRRLVVVGPPRAGKTTLALGLSAEESPAVRGALGECEFSWQMEGRHAVVSGVDLPGDDALRVWKQVITDKKPHLTVFVDFQKITSDAAERDRAERMAEHVNDMGAKRAALVLTHTDLDASSQGDPRAACESQRARLIAKRLGADHMAAANLLDRSQLDDLRTGWRSGSDGRQTVRRIAVRESRHRHR